MSAVRFGAIGLLASTALITGCSTDSAPQAMSAANAVNVAATTQASVDNFMLVDANLEAHELFRMTLARRWC